jgi:hypothetical protein
MKDEKTRLERVIRMWFTVLVYLHPESIIIIAQASQIVKPQTKRCNYTGMHIPFYRDTFAFL